MTAWQTSVHLYYVGIHRCMYTCTRESIERHLIKTEPKTNQKTNVKHESIDINLLNYEEHLLLS